MSANRLRRFAEAVQRQRAERSESGSYTRRGNHSVIGERDPLAKDARDSVKSGDILRKKPDQLSTDRR
jgi:hypothetical protein